MQEIDEELSLLSNLVDIEIGRREKRPICDSCSRPEGVCWCRGLGGQRVKAQSTVIVLQHPHEEKRCLRTAPILKAALPPEQYLELRGKRFSPARNPELAPYLSSPNTILMYPGEGARGLEDLPRVGEPRDEPQRRAKKPQEKVDEKSSLDRIQACGRGQAGLGEGQEGHGAACGGQEGHKDAQGGQKQPPYNIVILDGTWQQAKSIYHNCSCLHPLPQVCLSGRYTSEYIIRTQPTDDALSTVETAALALAILEDDWKFYEMLVGPLRVLCGHQLSHGAIAHQSKEFLLVSGRCRRTLGKRTYKKLKKCGARYPQALAALVTSGSGTGGKEEDKDGKEEEEERGETEEKDENKNGDDGLAAEIESEKIGIRDEIGMKIGHKEIGIMGNDEEIDEEGAGGRREGVDGVDGNKRRDSLGKMKRNISSHVSWELR